MWLMTRYGFYSAVASRGRNGKVDPKRLVVRARVKKHLEDLVAAFPDQLGGIKISSSEDTDYRHRIVVPKEVWSAVVVLLTLDVDYPNFKGACGHGSYHTALNRVWGVMMDLQSEEETEEPKKGKAKGTGGHRSIDDGPWWMGKDADKF